MEKKEINYKEVFNLFVSDSEQRPQLMHPYKQKGIYYATDVVALIFMPVQVIELDFPEQDSPKNLDKHIPKEITHNIEIKISDLEKKLVPEMIEEEIKGRNTIRNCGECDGSGKVCYKYNGKCTSDSKEFDCPCCDGSGTIEEIEKIKTGKMIANPNKIYKMNDVYFMYKQLKRLVDACKMMELESILKIFGVRQDANVFNCGKATILIMPAMVNDDTEVTIIS